MPTLRVGAEISSHSAGSYFGSQQGMTDEDSELAEERITLLRDERAPACVTIALHRM